MQATPFETLSRACNNNTQSSSMQPDPVFHPSSPRRSPTMAVDLTVSTPSPTSRCTQVSQGGPHISNLPLQAIPVENPSLVSDINARSLPLLGGSHISNLPLQDISAENPSLVSDINTRSLPLLGGSHISNLPLQDIPAENPSRVVDINARSLSLLTEPEFKTPQTTQTQSNKRQLDNATQVQYRSSANTRHHRLCCQYQSARSMSRSKLRKIVNSVSEHSSEAPLELMTEDLHQEFLTSFTGDSNGYHNHFTDSLSYIAILAGYGSH